MYILLSPSPPLDDLSLLIHLKIENVRTLKTYFLKSSVLVLLTALLLSSSMAYSQSPVDSTKKEHSVLKATLLSTFLPGAGQVYNHKIWKVPIIYAGFIGMASVIKFNNNYYKKFNSALIIRYDTDTTTFDDYYGKYSDTQLTQLSNNYLRNRNLGIIIFSLIYILNVVDANVDAQLFTFDVSDDLSLQVAPTIYQNNYSAYSTPVTGLNLRLTFK